MTAEAGSTAYTRRAVTVKDGFDAVPSVPYVRSVEITVATEVPDGAEAVAFPVGSDGAGASTLGIGVAALAAAGFDGRPGQSYVVAGDVPVRVAVGVGNAATIDADGIRDAAAAFGLATNRQARLAVRIPALEHVDAAAAAQVIVEGILLARYAYEPLKRAPGTTPVASITLVAEAGDRDDVTRGAERGRLFASAAMLSRDLANTPPAHLTAPRFGDIAERIGPAMGLEVELLDQAALLREGCGGILGVNGGSADEARLIKLTYRPKDDGGAHLALVAKGIMYDSGGISLKPSDAVHATMKNDMSGSAAVMGAMSILQALGCRTTVTGYLACTDNMPSGTALKLGDVITIHGGTTVEIMNTDAEGRLVMADALVIAAAEHPDAIVHDARPRHVDRRRHGQRRGRHRPGPRRLGSDRRAHLAVPARGTLPARARLGDRGSQEHGRPQRRPDHRRPVPRGIRGRDAMGPCRYRRRRHGRPARVVAPARLHRVRCPAAGRAGARVHATSLINAYPGGGWG
jgi:leucyl aminopeptidase